MRETCAKAYPRVLAFCQLPCLPPTSQMLSPKSQELLGTLQNTNKKVTLDAIIQSTEPDPRSSPGLMTSTQWARGSANKWGGNWGLRDSNISVQHSAYRLLESPTGMVGKGDATARDKKLLRPVPDLQDRGQAVIEKELRKIFQAYARPTNSFPGVNSKPLDADIGRHDDFSDRRIAELVMATNLARRDKFEALDENLNGKLSATELRSGMRNMGDVWLGIQRVKLFLGAKGDDDLSYQEFIAIVQDRIYERSVPEYVEPRDDLNVVHASGRTFAQAATRLGVAALVKSPHTREIAGNTYGQEEYLKAEAKAKRHQIKVQQKHHLQQKKSKDWSIGHLGFRRLVTDLLRFEVQGVHVYQLDKTFLLSIGYEEAMDDILNCVRNDTKTHNQFPTTMTYKQFRTRLIKALSCLLMPTPPPEFMGVEEDYDAEHVFIRHILLPNARRPKDDPGHPLYTNFYKSDVLSHLETYAPVLQFVFAHYATLDQYYNTPHALKNSTINLPGSWGRGNGPLRMSRSEFVAFCDNFGLIGSASRLAPASGESSLYFTRATANWVFTSAKTGAEAMEMCSDCTFSGLPVCEHLSFREFCEAICRIAVILYPLDGMRAPDLDMAARTTFNSDERGSVTLQRLLPSFQRQSTSKASHQDRSMFHSRSVSAEPLLERSLPRSDFQSSISSTFSDAAAAIITPRSPTRSNGLPMPASWIQGKLTPISQVF